jgi:hypothetical protein
MTVLRALLLRFHGRQGLCVPSYDALQRVTGLCRASIARALARLEDAGVVQITRRLVRYSDELGVVCVRQGSNIYGFAMPAACIDMGPTSQPLQMRAFPRVHRIGANHKPPQIMTPFERAIAGAVKRASRGPLENAAANEVLRQFRLLRGK